MKLVGGRDTDLYVLETVTGELHGIMPKPPCKKTMQNSSERAESHRSLTVKVEANSLTAQTATPASKDAIIQEQKSNISLPKPLSFDEYARMMETHLYANPGLYTEEYFHGASP